MYLEKEKNQKFVERLINIGSCIGKESKEDFKKTRENIFDITNMLVGELGLGGSVDVEQYDKLEKELFPGFFRHALAENIYNELKSQHNFQKGKFEKIRYENTERFDSKKIHIPAEYLCFYFNMAESKKWCDAKLIIGPFNNSKSDIFLKLFIEMNVERSLPGLLRYKSKSTDMGRRLIKFEEQGKEVDGIKISEPKPQTGKEKLAPIDFEDGERLDELYRETYPAVAKDIAERVGEAFQEARINELTGKDDPQKTGKTLSILEFMKQVQLID
jgi:hypothetical protein